jgi:hypothetical protein
MHYPRVTVVPPGRVQQPVVHQLAQHVDRDAGVSVPLGVGVPVGIQGDLGLVVLDAVGTQQRRQRVDPSRSPDARGPGGRRSRRCAGRTCTAARRRSTRTTFRRSSRTSRPRRAHADCGTSSCPAFPASATWSTRRSPSSWGARRSSPRRHAPARRRTPATWSCCTCSAPASRSSGGSSRCLKARSARASR